MSVIFLTGFMGAGKSSVGRLLAERLGRPFVDLDEEIERREQLSVTELFGSRGESGFRDAEHAALAAVIAGGPAVIATGGGAVLRADNQALLKQHGAVVYLSVTPEEAIARLGDGTDRPLLAGRGVEAAREILAGRLPVYAQTADIVVATDGKRVEQVAEEALAALAALAADESAPIFVSGGCTAGGYDVLVGPALVAGLGALVRPLLKGDRVALVTDETVWQLFGQAVEATIADSGLQVSRHIVPAGESSKSWEQAGRLLESFSAAGLDRDSSVLALGGGVVGDLAGFCAATYMRGIGVVQVPTTLLGQVDSAIGGKTAVDLPAGKNLVGAFWPPMLVVADTGVLATLPPAEWTNGLVELVKGAFLEGGETLEHVEADLERLMSREPAVVERSVRAAAAFKARVVSADLREADLRESLNFGHTLGHALELLVGYGVLPHGLAVAEGMRFAARLAESQVDADAALSARIAAALERVGAGEQACRAILGRATKRLTPAELLAAMKGDKKSRGGAVRFVLLREPGSWEARAIDDAALLAELERWSHDVAGEES